MKFIKSTAAVSRWLDRRRAALIPARRDVVNRYDRHTTEIGGKLAGMDAALAERLQRETANLHPTIGRHLQRTGIYASILARALGWPRERIEMVSVAAPLHDVGKLGVRQDIINKPGQLTDEEKAEMRRHCLIGHKMLSWGEHPIMKMAASIALSHHERWDGSGYPFKLRGPSIPVESRLVSVIDTYDAMRMRRSYKPAMSHDEAIDKLLNDDDRAAGQFDPQMLEALGEIHPRLALAFSALPDDLPDDA